MKEFRMYLAEILIHLQLILMPKEHPHSLVFVYYIKKYLAEINSVCKYDRTPVYDAVCEIQAAERQRCIDAVNKCQRTLPEMGFDVVISLNDALEAIKALEAQSPP